jgi:hypothetical protein
MVLTGGTIAPSELARRVWHRAPANPIPMEVGNAPGPAMHSVPRHGRQPLGRGGEPHRYRSQQSVRAGLVARSALMTQREATAVTRPTLRTLHGNRLLP